MQVRCTDWIREHGCWMFMSASGAKNSHLNLISPKTICHISGGLGSVAPLCCSCPKKLQKQKQLFTVNRLQTHFLIWHHDNSVWMCPFVLLNMIQCKKWKLNWITLNIFELVTWPYLCLAPEAPTHLWRPRSTEGCLRVGSSRSTLFYLQPPASARTSPAGSPRAGGSRGQLPSGRVKV